MKRALLLALLLASCSSRADKWDESPKADAPVIGLENSLAVVDSPLSRVVWLETVGTELFRQHVDIGRGLVEARASSDKKSLIVLTAGDVPRRPPKDDGPALFVLKRGAQGVERARYDLPSIKGAVSLDPAGRFAIVTSGSRVEQGVVDNPNELVIVDLEAPPSETNPVVRTIRSFGSRPLSITFTPRLNLPGGNTRLLVALAEQYVSLLDLEHVADREGFPDITVPLTSGLDARRIIPAAVTVDDGEPTRNDDTRLAVRADDRNVFVYELAQPRGTSKNYFDPKPNLVDVGGVPSDIAFVRTDAGIRLAALVPTISSAVLVDPATTIASEPIRLPAAYQRMSLTEAGAGASTALLWNATNSTSGVAFWSLGRSSTQPYRSIEAMPISSSIQNVRDVPARPELKVLESRAQGFFVLDTNARTVSPLAASSELQLHVSSDGERIWAFRSGSPELASVDVKTLGASSLRADAPVVMAHETVRPEGRELLLVHRDRGALAITVADARKPDMASAVTYAGLLLEGF